MIKKLFIVLCMFFFIDLAGQQSNTLFFMQSVPQSNYLNPAVKSACKLYIGFPLLTTLDINYSNSSFSFSNLIEDDLIQVQSIYNGLAGINIISAGLFYNPISLGYKFRGNYFTFSLAERMDASVSFTKNLVGLVLLGNRQFIGEEIHFHPRVNATYYREYSAGWAFDLDIFNHIGFKGKLLFGKADMGTGVSDILFGTAENSYDLSLEGNVALNASFPIEVSLSEDSLISGVDVKDIDIVSFLMNRRNKGLAFDFGYINEYLPEFTFSLSVLDFGGIYWKDEVNNVKLGSDFFFDGIQLEPGTSINDIPENLLDSLSGAYTFEVSQDPYFTFLPTQIYLGAQYHWTKNIDLGLLTRTVIHHGSIKSSATASINASLLNAIHGSLSWTYINRSINNFGAGLAFTGKGFQFYALTDNFYGFIRPVDTRFINIRFGMNLMFGCSAGKNEKDGQTPGHSMVPCPEFKTGRVTRSKKRW